MIMQVLAPKADSVRFTTRFSGMLSVCRDGDRLAMDFPSIPPWACANTPAELVEGLGKAPDSVLQIEDNYFAIYDSPKDIRDIRPDLRLLEKLHPFGVCVTAPGEGLRFRFALLRSQLWNSGRFGDRIDSLLAGSVLVAAPG